MLSWGMTGVLTFLCRRVAMDAMIFKGGLSAVFTKRKKEFYSSPGQAGLIII
jgi:hypothetical protein